MDPADFLKLHNEKVFGAAAEPVLKPEEVLQKRMDSLEQDRRLERERSAQKTWEDTKKSYISDRILPVLEQNKDLFEELHRQGRDLSAGFIYDFMNGYYNEHHVELDPKDVAETMEELCAKEVESQIQTVRGLKKYSKWFKEEVPAFEPLGSKISYQELPNLPSKEKDQIWNNRERDNFSVAQKQQLIRQKKNDRIKQIANMQ